MTEFKDWKAPRVPQRSGVVVCGGVKQYDDWKAPECHKAEEARQDLIFLRRFWIVYSVSLAAILGWGLWAWLS